MEEYDRSGKTTVPEANAQTRDFRHKGRETFGTSEARFSDLESGDSFRVSAGSKSHGWRNISGSAPSPDWARLR